jgi:hypothetical protein
MQGSSLWTFQQKSRQTSLYWVSVWAFKQHCFATAAQLPHACQRQWPNVGHDDTMPHLLNQGPTRARVLIKQLQWHVVCGIWHGLIDHVGVHVLSVCACFRWCRSLAWARCHEESHDGQHDRLCHTAGQLPLPGCETTGAPAAAST